MKDETIIFVLTSLICHFRRIKEKNSPKLYISWPQRLSSMISAKATTTTTAPCIHHRHPWALAVLLLQQLMLQPPPRMSTTLLQRRCRRTASCRRRRCCCCQPHHHRCRCRESGLLLAGQRPVHGQAGVNRGPQSCRLQAYRVQTTCWSPPPPLQRKIKSRNRNIWLG